MLLVLADVWLIFGAGGNRFNRSDGRSAHTGRAGYVDTSRDSAQSRSPVAPITEIVGHLGLGSGRASPAQGDNGMSQPSRPRTRGPAQRRRRDHRLDVVSTLEERYLLTPIVVVTPPAATFTPSPTPTNADLGTVTIAPATTTVPTPYPTQAPVTTVNQLTPASSFGGDIVRIEPGPGGAFGNYVYAISRGSGENAGAVNRPGVIYRVDPATGKTSVFFDLNTVVSQLPGDGTAAA